MLLPWDAYEVNVHLLCCQGYTSIIYRLAVLTWRIGSMVDKIKVSLFQQVWPVYFAVAVHVPPVNFFNSLS